MPSTYTCSTTSSQETLPMYKGPSVFVSEKELSQPEKKTSRFSTLKSILSGDVHKHNPYLTLERSVVASSAVDRPVVNKPSEKTSEKKSTSTMKSILTGDVHKYNAMYRSEESVSQSDRV